MNKQVKPSLNAPKDSSDKALEIAGISQKAEERKRRKTSRRRRRKNGGTKIGEEEERWDGRVGVGEGYI